MELHNTSKMKVCARCTGGGAIYFSNKPIQCGDCGGSGWVCGVCLGKGELEQTINYGGTTIKPTTCFACSSPAPTEDGIKTMQQLVQRRLTALDAEKQELERMAIWLESIELIKYK